MAEKTLYVSDLDGTLLRSDQRLSDYTIRTVHALVERGMLFTYATARSLVTASRVTAGLDVRIPAAVYNGSFLMDPRTGRRLLSNTFSPADAAEILDALRGHGVYPIVYTFLGEQEKFLYCPEHVTRGMRMQLDSRRGDVRETPVPTPDGLCQGEIFHFACIDEEEKLLPLYEQFRERFSCVYQRDLYSGEQWLEFQPRGASKAQAILTLKEYLGCERIVCFGDGKNDIPLFRIADERCAVANADEELKRMADHILEANDSDGVARWLEKRFCETE